MKKKIIFYFVNFLLSSKIAFTEEKIKIYTGWPGRVLSHPKHFEFIEKIAESKFDAIHLPYGTTEKYLNSYKLAHQLGLKIFIHLGLPYLNNSAVNEKGKKLKITCPMNEEIWEEIFKKVEIIFTEFKNEDFEDFIDSIIGIHFDIEKYVDEDICYCDKCFYKFKNISLPLNKRRTYLIENYMLEKYKEFLKENLIKILEKYERKIHNINSNLIISFYPFFWRKPLILKLPLTLIFPSLFPPPAWWYVYRKSAWISLAILKGLGNKEKPVLGWDDYYYWTGYSGDKDYIKRVNKFVKEYLGYEGWIFQSIDYISPVHFSSPYTPERAEKEYYLILKNSKFGAICYGEGKKEKDLWEIHLPYWKHFKKVNELF